MTIRRIRYSDHIDYHGTSSSSIIFVPYIQYNLIHRKSNHGYCGGLLDFSGSPSKSGTVKTSKILSTGLID
jgi:hypothetical protein